jgi:hypothetical protein
MLMRGTDVGAHLVRRTAERLELNGRDFQAGHCLLLPATGAADDCLTPANPTSRAAAAAAEILPTVDN